MVPPPCAHRWTSCSGRQGSARVRVFLSIIHDELELLKRNNCNCNQQKQLLTKVAALLIYLELLPLLGCSRFSSVPSSGLKRHFLANWRLPFPFEISKDKLLVIFLCAWTLLLCSIVAPLFVASSHNLCPLSNGHRKATKKIQVAIRRKITNIDHLTC